MFIESSPLVRFTKQPTLLGNACEAVASHSALAMTPLAEPLLATPNSYVMNYAKLMRKLHLVQQVYQHRPALGAIGTNDMCRPAHPFAEWAYCDLKDETRPLCGHHSTPRSPNMILASFG
ncbi:hypothetical protein [Stenotrophomonas phage CM2]